MSLSSTKALTPSQLKRRTDPSTLPKSTKFAAPFDASFGQSRAVKAIHTALDISASGYHIFAVGENGLGKRTLITKLLKLRAKEEPTPDDLVFVHNFDEPRLPIAIRLPTGLGRSLCQDIDKLWQSCHRKLASKFSSPAYQTQLANLKNKLSLEEKRLIDEFNKAAKPYNVLLNSIALDEKKTGIFSPLDSTRPIDANAQSRLQKKLVALNFALDELEDSINQKMDELHNTLAVKVLLPLFDPLLKKYQKSIKDTKEQEKVINHLNKSLDDMMLYALDIVDNEGEFTHTKTPARYAINVAVSHPPKSGAPIVFEELPTHLNLLGHIEYTTEMGTTYSDVSMIRAGALMRANGGYLLLEAQSLIEHPYAWQGLKRALQSKQIKLSSLEQMLTLTGSLSLEPMSVPLSIKVILMGEPELYYELLAFEPEFDAGFKIRADFNDRTERTVDSELAVVSKIADIVAKDNLLPFDNNACALIIDTLSMFCDDQNKLDWHTDRLSQLIVESHRHAHLEKSSIVKKTHLEQTLQDMRERTGFLKELYWQEIKNGQQLISTQGAFVGQINALTVISYADSEFGLPSRLTATIAPKFGDGEILDIERDVDLGGSLHAKGMLIMTSFLRAAFSQFAKMNFSASLAFEQSYDYIDGDSATLAETCVILSALADVPLVQNLAITGSMNQLGQAQAIGGVNAKIMGFFDVCQNQGLTGTQGVIIPRANIHNLMLGDEVIEAVNQGQFHIFAIDNVYEALALLTGIAIHDKNKKGEFKKNTLFYKVIKRLKDWENKDEN